MPTVSNKTSNKEEPAFHGIAEGASSIAVFGQGAAVGVRGDGSTWHGVAGISTSTTGGAGVHGANNTGGPGVIGTSKTWHGVYGETTGSGQSGAAGVWGEHKSNGSGIVGHSVSGAGVYGRSDSGPAGVFDGQLVVRADLDVAGDIEVAGDVRLLGGDVAELFDVAETTTAEPGTLMSIADDGTLEPSEHPYDTRVVGVIAGAGEFRPGLLLDSRPGTRPRHPIAMIGKACCKADATYGPIRAGDLLTTSPTPGHAMRVTDPSASQGAVVGKALAPLDDGRALIPIVVTLR